MPKNLIIIFLYSLMHFTLVGQKEQQSFCEIFVENKDLANYMCLMEEKFISNQKVDLNCLNIIVCTIGQLNQVLHIQVIDSLTYYHNYQYNNDLFQLIHSKCLPIKVDENIYNFIGNFQYYSCNLKTDRYTKEISVYFNEKRRMKIKYEGVAFSNNTLPVMKERTNIFEIINLDSTHCLKR